MTEPLLHLALRVEQDIFLVRQRGREVAAAVGLDPCLWSEGSLIPAAINLSGSAGLFAFALWSWSRINHVPVAARSSGRFIANSIPSK